MRRAHLLATISVGVVIAAAAPVRASPAAVMGLIAAGVVGAAVVISVNQSGAAWAYTHDHGWVGGAPSDVSTINTPLTPRRSIPPRIVSACRDAIAANAQRYDLASLEAVGASVATRVKGRIIAPIEVRAIYRVRGVNEVRRSIVRCEVDRAGRVVTTS